MRTVSKDNLENAIVMRGTMEKGKFGAEEWSCFE